MDNCRNKRNWLLSLSEHEILQILDYLDFLSLIKCGICCKVLYLLSNDCRGCNPSVITKTLSTFDQIPSLFDNLQSTPTCAIIFDTKHRNSTPSELSATLKFLPPTVQLLYAETGYVECASAGRTSYIGGKRAKKDGKFSIMLCAFPEADATSFIIEENNLQQEDDEDSFLPISHNELSTSGMENPAADWSVFILSAAADGFFPQHVVNSLQRLYPNAAILGGMTGRHIGIGKGSCYHPADPHSNGSIAVLALKGNVPIHCVVSKGVESLSPVYSVLPTSVSESGFRYCDITSLIDADGRSHTPIDVIGSFSTLMNSRQIQIDSVVVGIANNAAGPFISKELDLGSLRDSRGRKLSIGLDEGEPTPTHVSFFAMTADACKEDIAREYHGVNMLLRRAMKDAKKRFSSRGEEVIGCAMFSCSARGPLPSPYFFDTESLDANTYCKVFPHAPLLGSYCGGEIGPKAMAGLSAETIFRTGSATIQGFTAVFGLFAVPPRRNLELKKALQSTMVGSAPQSMEDAVSALIASKRAKKGNDDLK